MSLQSLLDLSSKPKSKQEISKERLMACMPELRKQIAFYREYPDIFIDDIKGEDSTFKFYYYQRLFLRAAIRHRKTYFTFPRGFSKSFLTMMLLMIRAVLYPGVDLFVTSGGKSQASSITIAKIEEICKIIPALSNEINWDRGKTKQSKDSVEYVFKNGSKITILPALESSRGQRKTGGVMEECVQIDPTMLNEVVIPTTVINRRLPNGDRRPEEKVNQSQTYITTAGFKDTFPYQRLIELLAESIIEPDDTFVMGGTWKIPVIEGLQPKNFIQSLKLQGSFDESSFDREYMSRWTGDTDKSYYSAESFDKNRRLLQPEYEWSGRSNKNAYYVLGVDVGRKDCTTEVTVIKVTPQAQGTSLKSIVCFYSKEAEHFEHQAIFLKKLFFAYKARSLVIDGNGLGVGLLDFMVIGQTDPETGDYLPPFGVEGGTYENAGQEYKKFKTNDMVKDAMFIIKANAPINTESHTYVQTQLSSGKVNFLIEERDARIKLMETKMGQAMTPEERNIKLMPFQLTDNLKNQMINLVEDNEGVNVILKQHNRRIPKDRFSSFEYGMYYVKQEEDRRKKRKTSSLVDLMFMG